MTGREPIHWADDSDHDGDPVDEILFGKDTGVFNQCYESFGKDEPDDKSEGNLNHKSSNDSCSTLLTKRHIYSCNNFLEPIKKLPSSPRVTSRAKSNLLYCSNTTPNKVLKTTRMMPTRISIIPKKTINLF